MSWVSLCVSHRAIQDDYTAWALICLPLSHRMFFFLFPSLCHQHLLGRLLKVRGWLWPCGMLLNNKETPLYLIEPGMLHAALFRNRSEHCSCEFYFGRPVFYLTILATYPFYPGILFCSLGLFQTCVQEVWLKYLKI